MSAFDAFLGSEDDLPPQSTSRLFDNEGYIGYDPRPSSERLEPFEMDEEHSEEFKDDEDHLNGNGMGNSRFTVDISENAEGYAQPMMFGSGFENAHPSDFTSGFNINGNGNGDGHGFANGEVHGIYDVVPQFASDGPILPDLHEMQAEEGFILREWRRQNAIQLEEKERREKEDLLRIMDEAESYLEEFYDKRKNHCETNKNNNREKEKVFVANQEKFHADADKEYWKAVAELVPHELPTIETKRGAKDKDKKQPTIIVNHGPKPGKPTDLTRMRQILLKLKHNPPLHMKPPPSPRAPAIGADPIPSTGIVPALAPSTAPVQAVAVA